MADEERFRRGCERLDRFDSALQRVLHHYPANAWQRDFIALGRRAMLERLFGGDLTPFRDALKRRYAIEDLTPPRNAVLIGHARTKDKTYAMAIFAALVSVALCEDTEGVTYFNLTGRQARARLKLVKHFLLLLLIASDGTILDTPDTREILSRTDDVAVVPQ